MSKLLNVKSLKKISEFFKKKNPIFSSSNPQQMSPIFNFRLPKIIFMIYSSFYLTLSLFDTIKLPSYEFFFLGNPMKNDN